MLVSRGPVLDSSPIWNTQLHTSFHWFVLKSAFKTTDKDLKLFWGDSFVFIPTFTLFQFASGNSKTSNLEPRSISVGREVPHRCMFSASVSPNSCKQRLTNSCLQRAESISFVEGAMTRGNFSCTWVYTPTFDVKNWRVKMQRGLQGHLRWFFPLLQLELLLWNFLRLTGNILTQQGQARWQI